MTRLLTALCLEISSGQSIILVPAQSPLPASWEQSFSTSYDNQQTLDLHLMRQQEGENYSYGRWRISGFPTRQRGALLIKVKVTIDQFGAVRVSASLNDEPLIAVRQTGNLGNLPVSQTGELFLMGSQPPASNDPSDPAPDNLHLLDDDKKEYLRQRGFEISRDGRLVQGNQIVKKGLFGRRLKSIEELSPQEIINLVGEPLSPDESRRCPNPRCGATIPLNTKRCEWCGEKLFD